MFIFFGRKGSGIGPRFRVRRLARSAETGPRSFNTTQKVSSRRASFRSQRCGICTYRPPSDAASGHNQTRSSASLALAERTSAVSYRPLVQFVQQWRPPLSDTVAVLKFAGVCGARNEKPVDLLPVALGWELCQIGRQVHARY